MAIERAPEQVGVDDALLQLLAQQGRRVPYPVGLSAVVIALMAGDKVSPWFSGLWVALVFAVLALRWWALGRLPQLAEVPVRRRLQWALMERWSWQWQSPSPWAGDRNPSFLRTAAFGVLAFSMATPAAGSSASGTRLLYNWRICSCEAIDLERRRTCGALRSMG